MAQPRRSAAAIKNGASTNGEGSGEIVLQRLGRLLAYIPIEGTSILVCNKFAEKAKQQILDKHMGKTRVREHKDPEANFMAARHRLDDGRDGVPATALKGAIVGAGRFYEGVTMTELQQMIFVMGEGPEGLVPIEGTAVMREDAVRNETGVADIRHRPMYWPWRIVVPVVFLKGKFSLEAIVNLVDAAGNGGIGEGRPSSKKSKTGMWGMWKVVDEQTIRVVTL